VVEVLVERESKYSVPTLTMEVSMAKIIHVCHECGSDDFVVQAEVMWNSEDQAWKVINFPEMDDDGRIEIDCKSCDDYSYMDSSRYYNHIFIEE